MLWDSTCIKNWKEKNKFIQLGPFETEVLGQVITSGPIVESMIFLDTFPDGRVGGWRRIENSAISDQTELGLAGLSLAIVFIKLSIKQ